MQHDSREIKITVNGDTQSVLEGTTVRELLDSLGIRGAAAVEKNWVMVARAHHANEKLADGDSLEIVQLVGGG
jgi:sulfur carrier protein